MVSSIGNGVSNSNVSQVMKEQQQRVVEQKDKKIQENTRQEQFDIEQEARVEQQNNIDERRGNTVNISI